LNFVFTLALEEVREEKKEMLHAHTTIVAFAACVGKRIIIFYRDVSSFLPPSFKLTKVIQRRRRRKNNITARISY
jgi:hypothetical protein